MQAASAGHLKYGILNLESDLHQKELENIMAGRGKKFNFHGRFLSKEEAVSKEKEVSGFIRERIVDGKTYYYVLTSKS